MIQHWLNNKSREESLHCHLVYRLTYIRPFQALSGKGTTHNTNGIAVHHAQCQLPVTVAQAPSTVEAKKTKQRSLVALDEDIIMFVGEKKSSPEAFSADIE